MKKIILFPFNFKNKTGFLLDSSLKGNPGESLYMAPHISKIRDFKMKYHFFYPANSLLPATYSMKTLALKLLDEFSGCRIISEVEKYVAILAVLKKRGADTNFRHNLSGVALAILQFIKDIKASFESDMDYHAIRQGIKNYQWKFDDNLNVLLEAVNVMEEYENFLKKEKLIDSEDIYREAYPYVDSVQWKNLVIEGFYEIPPYQKTFISALINKIDRVSFSFCYDENISPDVKELILERTLGFLNKVSCWREERARGDVFNNRVDCYNFSSQPEEVKGIVNMIWSHFAENPGSSLDDVMAVFPSMLSYRPVVQRIFGRYQLPCEIMPGYSLSRDSSISSLLEFFNFQDTFDWEVLMNILMNPHFSKIDEDEAGKFSSCSRKEFENTGFFRENFNALSGKNFRTIKSLLKETEGSSKPSREWIKNISSIIRKLGWQPGLAEVKFSFEMALEALKSDTVFTREEFLSVLMKSFELVDIQEGRGQGVKVSGVQESVGIEKKLCFIGGATEENIPQAPSVEEVFIPDMLKKSLGFTDYSLRIARERFDIYRLKKENERVVFTYPSKIEGKNQMKSIFLFEQEDLFPPEDSFKADRKELFRFSFSSEKFKKKFAPGGKLRLSVTQLEKLMKCSYRFYIENVEDIGPYKKPETGEAPDLWGNLIHRVMQEIFSPYKGCEILPEFENGLEDTFKKRLQKEILALYKQGAIASFYRDVMMMRLGEVAKKFHEIVSKHTGAIIKGIEEEISIELPSIILRGKIDRIEKVLPDKISIIDIKTGTSGLPSYTGKDFFLNFNLQLPLYIWMYGKKFGIDKESISGSIWSFHFMEDEGKDIEKVYSYKKLNYLENVEDYLAVTAEYIMGRDDFGPEKPAGCFFCRYKGMCPYEKT